MALMKYIIGATLAVLVLGALITTIADETVGRQGVGNITGATSVMLGLVPVILLIGVVWKLWKGSGTSK